jgi:hypothetical protein
VTTTGKEAGVTIKGEDHALTRTKAVERENLHVNIA